jgi:hypothetical protein
MKTFYNRRLTGCLYLYTSRMFFAFLSKKLAKSVHEKIAPLEMLAVSMIGQLGYGASSSTSFAPLPASPHSGGGESSKPERL